MGNNRVELDDFLTVQRVEWAHGQACIAQQQHRQNIADVGWRAALARDPRLLKTLEIGAEKIGKLGEEQNGRTRRSADTFAESVEHTEFQLWREAYRLCDEGNPIRNFEWIYGAAAILCGYVE
jgi:hypothetical protein